MTNPGGKRAALASLAAAAMAAAPAGAQTGDTHFRREALAHARALQDAWYGLEHHIRRTSTEATAWDGSTPPPATRWRADWTARGIRARYCGGILVVYFGPAELKGTGADHRAVQVAPQVAGSGEPVHSPPLDWLRNDAGVNRVVDTRHGGSVDMPACMTAAGGGPLPAGGPARAGPVEDPWTVTRDRTTWETRESMTCPAGWHRPHTRAGAPQLAPGRAARRERRTVTQPFFPKRDAAGDPIPAGDPVRGPWEEIHSLCRADFTAPETELRNCTFRVPGGENVPGHEIWRRDRSVTASADGMGVVVGGTWALSSSSCTGVLAPRPPPVPVTPASARVSDRDVVTEEVRTAACPPGQTGASTERRYRTVVRRTFRWPDGTVTRRDLPPTWTNWVTTVTTCEDEWEMGLDGDLDDGGYGDDGGDGGGDDGCFLTTAVVMMRGDEPDDGPTLTALRAFRDGYMSRTAERRRLVRKYYETAPRIVAAIPAGHEEWTWISERIDAAVAALADRDPDLAFRIYVDSVNQLAVRWLDAGADLPQ